MIAFCQKVLLVIAFLSVSFFTGCDDYSYDRSNMKEHFSRRISATHDTTDNFVALSGKFSLDTKLIPQKIKITSLDENLEEIETFEAKISKNDSLGYVFSSDSNYFPTTYAKLTFTCTRGDTTNKMFFEEYVDFAQIPSPTINLLGALESKRVKDLVQNDGFYLGNAKKKAAREIFKMLGLEWQEAVYFESDSIKFDALRLMPYLLAKYNESDSVFMENFEAMSSAVKNNEFGGDFYDTLWIADVLLQHYSSKVKESDSASFVYFTTMWENAYGLPACDSLGALARINNDESALNGKSLVCDFRTARNDSVYFWRYLDSLDLEFEPCYYGNEELFQHNDTVYACSPTSLAWVPANAKTAIEFIYGECRKELSQKTRSYHGNILLCTEYTDSDTYRLTYKWTDTISEAQLKKADFEMRFFEKYGDCTEERENEKVEFDEHYYQCLKNKWEGITGATYISDDSCENDDKLRLPTAEYFRCEDNHWKPIRAYEYYEYSCDSSNVNDVLKIDSTYFFCKYSEPLYDEDSKTPVWEWMDLSIGKKITSNPNGDSCIGVHFVQYQNTTFICKDELWEYWTNETAYRPMWIKNACEEYVFFRFSVYDSDSTLCFVYEWQSI